MTADEKHNLAREEICNKLNELAEDMLTSARRMTAQRVSSERIAEILTDVQTLINAANIVSRQ